MAEADLKLNKLGKLSERIRKYGVAGELTLEIKSIYSGASQLELEEYALKIIEKRAKKKDKSAKTYVSKISEFLKGKLEPVKEDGAEQVYEAKPKESAEKEEKAPEKATEITSQDAPERCVAELKGLSEQIEEIIPISELPPADVYSHEDQKEQAPEIQPSTGEEPTRELIRTEFDNPEESRDQKSFWSKFSESAENGYKKFEQKYRTKYKNAVEITSKKIYCCLGKAADLWNEITLKNYFGKFSKQENHNTKNLVEITQDYTAQSEKATGEIIDKFLENMKMAKQQISESARTKSESKFEKSLKEMKKNVVAKASIFLNKYRKTCTGYTNKFLEKLGEKDDEFKDKMYSESDKIIRGYLDEETEKFRKEFEELERVTGEILSKNPTIPLKYDRATGEVTEQTEGEVKEQHDK